MKVRDMTIGARILAGYGVVLAMMLALGVFSVVRIASLSHLVAAAGNGTGSGMAVDIAIMVATLAAGVAVAFFSWRDTRRIMARVADGIEGSARAIAQVAADMTSIGRSLAANASRQAATVQETTAALEEISAVSRETAELTAGSEQLMHENIEKSGQSLKALVELTRNMGRIEEDSGKIRKIITTIDSIAFQTNLLALNAAVEAARAGEAGAGFAVVADEVKNLANRAAEAAKNTQVLLDNTVKQVTDSAESLKQVNGDFDAIVSTATRIGDKTAAITEASRQQSRGIGEIARAANEMDQVTQALAAEAANASGAADLLTGQAEEMGVMVNHLLRLVFGGRRRAAAITASRADVRCWEMKNCPDERRDNCPAYPDQGNACWTVTGTMCGGEEQGSYHEKIENCRKCDVFAAAHGQAGEAVAADVRCWEVKNCPDERRGNCPAYPDQGNACWTVTGTMCGGEEQGSYHEKIENCRKCEVYRMVRDGAPVAMQVPMVH